MFNLLKAAALLLVIFGVVGYFFDWYSIDSFSNDDDTTQIGVSINKENIKESFEKGKEVISDVADKAKNKAEEIQSSAKTGQSMTGKIKGFDLVRRELKVEDEAGQIHTMALASDLVVKKAAGVVDMSALSLNDAIDLRWHEVDGKKTVSLVEIR